MFNHEENNNSLFQEGIIEDSLGAAKDSAKNMKDDWINKSSKEKANSIRDIGDKARSGENKIRSNTLDNSSIIARARKSVLQFPVYAVQTLRVNEAHIISKLFERVYATLVQTVLAQNPVMSEEEANDLVFLRKFHSNIKEAADVFVNKYYEPIDDIDKMICESIFYSQKITENCTVEFSVIPTTDQNLIMENARLINEPLSGFGYFFEAKDGKDISKEVTTQTKNTTLSEDDLISLAYDRGNFSTSDRNLINKSDAEIKKSYQDKEYDKIIEKKRNLETELDKELKDLKNDIKNGSMGDNYKFKNGRYYRIDNSRSVKTTERSGRPEEAIKAPVFLRDSDVKKINGLLPYSIEATFRIRTNQGLDRDIHYIVGIKTVLHLIRTQDLADELEELVTGNIKSLQKVRYKTGEISFLDYLLNIKGIKSDAAKNINYNKRWINTLKRLSDYSKLNGSVFKNTTDLLTNGNVPIPNGTLILTQSDVTTLINQTGIDLSVISNAKKLAKSLFLISIVIVDSSAGTMRVLFPDNDNSWDVQSLASIDAEVSKTDNSQLMKELNRMVNH